MHRPLYICGPTASGKSAFAIALAKRVNGEIINGDPYQLYKGIETLSAAPSTNEVAEVPHHLYSMLETSELMDAQRYRELALPCIESVQQRGKTPIIVGGSGMYLKFLTHGPSPVPSGDEALRMQLEKHTDEELVKQLQDLDPEGASITNLKNRRYVIRAIEICLLSGEKMSDIKSDWKKQSDKMEQNLKGAVLCWEPDTLRKRIFIRTEMMLNGGAVEEVQQLTNPSITCNKAIGISAIKEFLAGNISRARCHELIYFATSQYAKRQRTWFKKEQWLTQLSIDEASHTDTLVEHFIENTL